MYIGTRGRLYIYYYIQMSYTHYTAAARAGEPAAPSRHRVDRSSAHITRFK